MPFIPHTPADLKAMLATIHVDGMNQLFSEIPSSLPTADLTNMPSGINEYALSRLFYAREPTLNPGGCFIGAGAYEHHIPAAVWQIVGRGEFLTAYTPYQAEASQGSLQLIYEYQTLMTQLMSMDVANASLYDGATALVEAVLMALRLRAHSAKGDQRILLPMTVHPVYRHVLATYLQYLYPDAIQLVPFCPQQGRITRECLQQAVGEQHFSAIVIPQPNFFGCLEEVDELTDFIHQQGGLVIGVVNPTAMSLLKQPGRWGTTNKGVDIVCGEGQPLGVPLASGGPYIGFLCCRKEYIRQLPGRLVGRTEDNRGRQGFVLTLQTREQHIRRAKATSNICTNQGLMVTATTIYLSLLGSQGLYQVAAASHQQARSLCKKLTDLPGVKKIFNSPLGYEFVIELPKPVDEVLASLREQGIHGGFSLQNDYPELKNCLLICATETKTEEDILRYQQCLAEILKG